MERVKEVQGLGWRVRLGIMRDRTGKEGQTGLSHSFLDVLSVSGLQPREHPVAVCSQG